MYNYDVIIIGSGPAGYVCAIRMAQLGKRVCVIEKENVGGVCLNKGCIPTKALLQSAKFLKYANKAKDFGIDVKNFNINLEKVFNRKDDIISQLRNGIEFLFNQRGIELIRAKATLRDEHTVEIEGRVFTSEFVIIATGSSPMELPNLRFDDSSIISSDKIFEIRKIPKTILIVGGGAIGCEFATILNLFGSKVTLLELMEHILPNEDREIAKKLQIQLEKNGIRIFTKLKVDSFVKKEGSILIKFSNGQELEFETILVCVGRKINSEGIGLEKLGISLNEKGYIVVDEYLKTNLNNIYAIGDVIGGYLLAHVASYEGIKAAENISGLKSKISYKAIPSCVFTEPEFASVGLSEEKAKNLGMDIAVGRFPFKSHGKSRILSETEGLIKVIIDKKNKIVLGAQILGYNASELISTFTTFINSNLGIEDLKEIIFAHPTISEAIGESILSAQKSAIHIL